MAPRNSRGGKAKGEKKKKEEKGMNRILIKRKTFFEVANSPFSTGSLNIYLICDPAVLPVVMDITINLPDETRVILRVCSSKLMALLYGFISKSRSLNMPTFLFTQMVQQETSHWDLFPLCMSI